MRIPSDLIRTKSDEAAIDAGCTFDIERAERVRRFFERYLRHSKGADANRPFILHSWQWDDVVKPAFGWIMPDGTRRYRHINLFVPKKNGKSTLLAGLSSYLLLCDDEPGAEVYSAAADKRQATIIFAEAAEMVRSSPALKKMLTIRDSIKKIRTKKGNSFYEALSSESATKEGFNIHGLLFDEIHAQPDYTLWDTLKYGGAARRQPMFWKISTAGIIKEGAFWWDTWQTCKRLLAGTDVDIATLAVIYAAGEGDDWTDEATWRKANPGYDLGTLNKRDIASECETAKKNAAEQATFKRYRLNIPVTASSAWIDKKFWDACMVDERPRGAKVHTKITGLDLASTVDLNAAVNTYKLDDCLYCEAMFWCPQLKVEERERSNRQSFANWIRQGWIKQTPTAYTDYNVIHDDLIAIFKKEKQDECAVDAWNFTQLAVDLKHTMADEHMKTIITPVRTGFVSISAATKELERMILGGKLKILRNPVLDWMFTNVVIEQDASGNRKPDRKRASDKIDGIVALILALARHLAKENVGKSKYENKELTFVRPDE
jgi:phage terminase large subunit-like protein